MFKKLLTYLLLICLVFALAGCSRGGSGSGSSQLKTAKEFVKNMIDCNVDKAFSQLDGEAYLNYLYGKDYLLELSNRTMKNTKLEDYEFFEYEDTGVVVIWMKDSPIPLLEKGVSYYMPLQTNEFFSICMGIVKNGKEMKINYLKIPNCHASLPDDYNEAYRAAAASVK